jgi:hypothetical protein
MIHGDAYFAYFNKIWGIPIRAGAPRFAVDDPANNVEPLRVKAKKNL